eukprot:6322524-Pyramimonas_sp.AAC.1
MLATVGQTQDVAGKPLIVAGGFNLQPRRHQQGADFLARATMGVAAPKAATYRTKKTKSTLDLFIHSPAIRPRLETPCTLTSNPMSPRSPATMAVRAQGHFKRPTLIGPQKPPHLDAHRTSAPVG